MDFAMTLQEIAALTGISHQRVDAVIRNGIRRLWRMQVQPQAVERVALLRRPERPA